MPVTGRYPTKTSYRRKTYRKKKYYPYPNRSKRATAPRIGTKQKLYQNPRQSFIQRGQLPFGPKAMVRLPYVSEIAVVSTYAAGVTAGNAYRLNSLYDPDITGAGLQPRQFDQLAAIYGKYIVHGAKITVEFSNPTVDGVFVGIGVRSSSGVSFLGKTLSDVRERQGCQVKSIANSGEQYRRFSHYVTIADLFGITKNQYSSEASIYGALVTTNPVLTGILEVFTLSSANDSTTRASVQITYYGQMNEYIAPDQS
jgi:hypothetical protein